MEWSLEDIKQELKDYFSNQTIINEYERSNCKIEELYERATKVTSTLSDMPKGSSEVQDNKVAGNVAEYVDLQQVNVELEKEYAVGMMKLKNRNLVVHHTIMSLRNPFKAILMHIYENNKTRDEAAEILEKSRTWIDTMIGVALMEYLKARNERKV
jgi:hypothetical protein